MIHLYGDYYMTADNLNFIITERYVNGKTGEVQYKQLKFFGTIDKALKEVVNMSMRDCLSIDGVETFGGFVKRFERVFREISAMVTQLYSLKPTGVSEDAENDSDGVSDDV